MPSYKEEIESREQLQDVLGYAKKNIEVGEVVITIDLQTGAIVSDNIRLAEDITINKILGIE